MLRPRRILIVEDDPDWLEDVRDTLRLAGFEEVEAVATREEASRLLSSKLFHVLVLDIRLEDQDPSNEEGMEFLRELSSYGISEAIHVVILTAYGTEDHMRESFRKHGVEDFVRKHQYEEDEQRFLDLLEETFQEKLEINLDLEIHWKGGLTPEKAVWNLRLPDSRVQRGSSEEKLLAEELEDLLCRLFHSAQGLLVEPLGDGKSGAGVLLVQPFFEEGGGGRPVVVKFGDVAQIQMERDNFDRYVQPYLGGGRHTSPQTHRRGPRLGGIAYSLLGMEGKAQSLSDFASFYRRASQEEIHRVLDGLFRDTCGVWYENPGQKKILELTPYYFEWLGMTPEGVQRGLESLKSVQGKDKLHFQGLTENRPWPHPLAFFPSRPLAVPTYQTLTHGDLHPQNILLDEKGNSWLIDFQATGPGHFLRDAVELDTAIRIGLLDRKDLDLDACRALEEALAAPSSFSDLDWTTQEPPVDHPEVSKAFRTCLHLRRLAGTLIARHSDADLTEYLAGCLFCALNMTRFLSYPKATREHALLSACVLTERLGF